MIHRFTRRRLFVVLTATLVCLTLVPTSVGAAGPGVDARETSQNQTTITVRDASTTTNGTTTVRVALTDAPTGLSGYELTLTLDSPSVATVTGATYPAGYQPTTDPDIGTSSQTVTLEAADVSDTVSAGATNVTLAKVNVSGTDTGSTVVRVTDVQLDDDDGDKMAPARDTGRLAVGSTVQTRPDSSSTGTETDSDSSDSSSKGPSGRSTESQSVTEDEPDTTSTGAGPGLGPLASIGALVGTILLLTRRP